MQSEQEELAKLFCEMAMGMPFVFVPDKYDKGSARREPADLVWACNGCLVLIYLSRMKRASKARQHNARQIKGWIRAWRSLGQVLRGRNQYGPIAIHAGDTRYPHVVILSIIECSDATAEYHYAETQALGVTMFATVPLSAIAHLSHMHASMLDVFHVLDWLRVRHTAAITETEIHAGISGYSIAAWRASGAELLWPSSAFDPQRAVIDHFLYSLRALAPEAFRDLREMLGDINPADKELNRATDALLVARVFGDLTLFESLCIAVQLKKTIDAFVVRAADSSRPPRTAQIILQHLPLTHYDMTLCLVSADGPHPREETALSALEDFARQHDRTGARPWGPALVVFVKEQGASFIHAIPIVLSQILPSATELFLDRVRSEQYA